MILNESAQSDTKAPSTVQSGDLAEPQSPPPYDSTTSQSGLNPDEKPLPTLPLSPTQDFSSGPKVPLDLPPRCNNLVVRNRDGRVKGVWHVDTALSIPESLLAPLENFDGLWNEAERKSRKERMKDKNRGADLSSASTNEITRPNLMLHSGDGSVSAEVHVDSSDGCARPAVIIAESKDGSVTLDLRTYSEQPLRIFALSNDGSVRVKIPKVFEGAVIMSTYDGSTNFSDSVKSRLTTFSTASKTTRGFIGDWQSAQFGTTPSLPTSSLTPSAETPLPTTSDAFTSWAGPLVYIASKDGSIHLSFSDDEPPVGASGQGGISSKFKGIMNELFGGI